MKYLNCLLVVLITPLFANAEVILERELFNARNGESYVCKIHSDANKFKTELINEGISVGKFDTEFEASSDNVQKWVKELKAQANKSNKFPMESKAITQYAQRGLKQYSLYNGGKKMSYYTLQQYKPKGKKTKLGSIEYKVKNDNSNVQRLRGQTDIACKKATAKL